MAETRPNPEQPSDSVRIVLFDPTSGEFIAVQETDDPDLKLPGGKLKTGEIPKDAALRELAEELGLDVDPESIIHVGDLPNAVDPSKIRHIFAGILNGEIKQGNDIAEVVRLFLDAIPEGTNQKHILSAGQLALDSLMQRP